MSWIDDITPGGIITNLGSKIIDTIAGFFPNKEKAAEAAAALRQSQLNGEFKVEEGELALLLEQAKTNEAEAKSTNWFVAGWRPAVGWVCAASFAYAFVLAPLLNFFIMLTGSKLQIPAPDISTMMPVLLGMLGLGSMRSYEKARGVQGSH